MRTDQLVDQERGDHQDLRDLLDSQDQRDHLDHQERTESQGIQDHGENLASKERLVLLALLV